MAASGDASVVARSAGVASPVVAVGGQLSCHEAVSVSGAELRDRWPAWTQVRCYSGERETVGTVVHPPSSSWEGVVLALDWLRQRQKGTPEIVRPSRRMLTVQGVGFWRHTTDAMPFLGADSSSKEEKHVNVPVSIFRQTQLNYTNVKWKHYHVFKGQKITMSK